MFLLTLMALDSNDIPFPCDDFDIDAARSNPDLLEASQAFWLMSAVSTWVSQVGLTYEGPGSQFNDVADMVVANGLQYLATGENPFTSSVTIGFGYYVLNPLKFHAYVSGACPM